MTMLMSLYCEVCRHSLLRVLPINLVSDLLVICSIDHDISFFGIDGCAAEVNHEQGRPSRFLTLPNALM